MHKAVVTALGHISERWRKEIEQPSSFSGIATWRGKNSKQQECRNRDMRNRDSIAAVEYRSGGEQTTGGEENDTKGDTTGMGPFLDTPPFRTPPPFN
jgi:hypothetical protein